ncbi:PstS family phosphate ABC transporter substrate-binding protein [Tistlia consotensis]|uniref:PstS family phosphate ABC transporter substrate-binding protein n=1 Tax=Tistlia consotensis TaxID=1321365 RepID=UPI0013566E46|nr:substrate-binding domain-containing protein [Tistlia consotensis]
MLLAPALAVPAMAADALRIGGTGAALAVADALGKAFAAGRPEVEITVLPSLGSSGALRALADGAVELAIAARPLKPEERAAGLDAVLFARTPFVFVTARPSAQPLDSAALAALYADPAPHWADGTPLRIVLRPETDSDSTLLAERLPGMAGALALARRRPEVPVAATDQDNLRIAQEMPGSLTAATLLQLLGEGADLRLLPLDGVAPGLEALEAGRYPLFKELYLVTRRDAGPTTRAFLAFLASDRARTILRRAGGLPLL